VGGPRPTQPNRLRRQWLSYLFISIICHLTGYQKSTEAQQAGRLVKKSNDKVMKISIFRIQLFGDTVTVRSYGLCTSKSWGGLESTPPDKFRRESWEGWENSCPTTKSLKTFYGDRHTVWVFLYCSHVSVLFWDDFQQLGDESEILEECIVFCVALWAASWQIWTIQLWLQSQWKVCHCLFQTYINSVNSIRPGCTLKVHWFVSGGQS